MHLKYRNVNTAFEGIVKGVLADTLVSGRSQSRNGPVIRLSSPTIVTYEKPCERVLFNKIRDANPFFHLYESLWMLAGRNDVASLDYYNSNMKNYSDDGVTFHGAYGYRWRKQMGYDQLAVIADILRTLPNDRRAVLQMWDAKADLDHPDEKFLQGDLIVGSRGGLDVCCNLEAVFELTSLTRSPKLNMTVFNRSNDAIWGMFGANVVHFSFLQEFMAAWIGVKVGKYHQITTNLHIYENKWLGEKYLSYEKTMHEPDYKDMNSLDFVPLVKDITQFEKECPMFVDNVDGFFKEPFLANVAQPMCLAFRHHKERQYTLAFEAIERVAALDWKIAGRNWLNKRRLNWKNNKQDV